MLIDLWLDECMPWMRIFDGLTGHTLGIYILLLSKYHFTFYFCSHKFSFRLQQCMWIKIWWWWWGSNLTLCKVWLTWIFIVSITYVDSVFHERHTHDYGSYHLPVSFNWLNACENVTTGGFMLCCDIFYGINYLMFPKVSSTMFPKHTRFSNHQSNTN